MIVKLFMVWPFEIRNELQIGWNSVYDYVTTEILLYSNRGLRYTWQYSETGRYYIISDWYVWGQSLSSFDKFDKGVKRKSVSDSH